MKNKLKNWSIAIGIVAMLFSSSLFGQNTVLVGGEQMYPNKDIIENAVNSKDHTTLVAAVNAAELVNALKQKGPFTVFAPANAAFNLLPDGTVEGLLKPENKATLTKILTYHVVSGDYSFDALVKLIKAGKGKASIKTLQGDALTFLLNGERNILVKDSKGNIANIAIYDVKQSNGVIHSIDKVLMP